MKSKNNQPMFVTQYCLEPQPCIRFIKDLPRRVEVKEIAWRGYVRPSRSKLVIPAYLARLGLKHSYSVGREIDIAGKTAGMNNENMIKGLTRIARSYKLEEKRMAIKHITLKSGKDQIMFRRMYKQIKLPNDRRRRKLVLGMVKTIAGNSQKILQNLSAKKITCKLMKSERTIVMCSEEVVI